jgi:hypothetical protein
MQFFYHKALEESQKKETKVDPDNFRYPGPKPRSKETAVVMIADSLEAATRSLPHPSKNDIMELINRIIENKTNEGQLDDSPMTMSDIKKIKLSFFESLISAYHVRPIYPKKEQTEKLAVKNNAMNGNVKLTPDTKPIKHPKKSGSKVDKGTHSK